MTFFQRTTIWLFLGLFIVGLSSCSNLNENLTPNPVAFGKVNQIVVVTDQSLWNSDIRDSIEYHFQAPYPILPQPEPFFDLRYFSPSKLNGDHLRKELKSYLIIANLNDINSEATKLIRKDLSDAKLEAARTGKGFGTAVGYDKWAQGQIIMYLYSYSREGLSTAIRESFPALSGKIRVLNKKQREGALYGGGENYTIKKVVKDSLGLNIMVPREYFIAVKNDAFAWLRYETNKTSNNIMLTKIPYVNKEQFSKEYIKNLRDSLGYVYVASTAEEAYMKINDVDLPMVCETGNLAGQYAMECRGIWEMEGDFLGGPYVSYLFSSPDSKHLIFADAFIHAPGELKRDLLQDLEYIIDSISF